MPTDDLFDHYHLWLGIPPDEQPPTHYRLLGLRTFESDPRVIINASDRQMSHVRSFQHGPFGALSQRLLNEIAAARVCLLNRESKRDYDQHLRSLAAPATDAPIEQTTLAPTPQPIASVPQSDQTVRPEAGPGVASRFNKQGSTRIQRSRSKKKFRWQAAVSLSVALLLFIGCAIYLLAPEQQAGTTPEPKPGTATLRRLQPTRPLDKQAAPSGDSVVGISSDRGAVTGVIVEPGGLVLTAYDQVAGRSMLRVKSQSGKDHEVAGVVAADSDRGLVLLSVPELAATKGFELSNQLPAQGGIATLISRYNPMHSAPLQVTTVIRSGRDARALSTVLSKQGFAEDITWLQVFGATPAIKSGAALINPHGQLMGLHLFSDPSQNLHLAVSSETIRHFLSSADRRSLSPPISLPVRATDPPIVKVPSQSTPAQAQPAEGDSVAQPGSQDDLRTWVDLLEQYDSQQPGQIGVWQMQGDRLALVKSSGKASTTIASSLKGSFDFAIDFSSSSDELRLTLFLPTGRGQCMLDLVSAGMNPIFALASTTDGRRIAVAKKLPRKLLPNRPHQLLVSMRVNGRQLFVDAMLDADPSLHWEGPASDVTVLDRSLGNSETIGVSVGNAMIHVHKAMLRRTSPVEPSLSLAPESRVQEAQETIGAGKWQKIYTTSEDFKKWTTDEYARNHVKAEGGVLTISSPGEEMNSTTRYPAKLQDVVVRASIQRIRGLNAHIELRCNNGAGYGFAIEDNGYRIGRYDRKALEGFKDIQANTNQALPRQFELMVAAIGSELVLWIDGTKRLQVSDSAIQSAGDIQIGVFGNAEAQFSRIELLSPTRQQARTFVNGR